MPVPDRRRQLSLYALLRHKLQKIEINTSSGSPEASRMRWKNFTQVMSGRAMLAPTIMRCSKIVLP